MKSNSGNLMKLNDKINMSCLMLTDTIKQGIYSYANTNMADLNRNCPKSMKYSYKKVRRPGGL